MAQSAQQSIPIPEGLNLDAWIVPPPQEIDEERKIKKSKKGKGKEINGSKPRSGKRKKGDHVEEIVEEDPVASQDLETPEERAQREQVNKWLCFPVFLVSYTLLAQNRTARTVARRSLLYRG